MNDWKRTALYLAALLTSLYCRPSSSQCVETFNITGSESRIVESGVQTCFRCLFDGAVVLNTLWRILDGNIPIPIDPSIGQVNDGILTIFDPITIVPNTGFQNERTLVCDNIGTTIQQHRIRLTRRGLVPPVIVSTSGTTVNEGDSFRLTCDHSESSPVMGLYWLVNGSVVEDEQSSQLQMPTGDTLQFTNISRNYSGEYNCTIEDDRNNTVSSVENIVVQFSPEIDGPGDTQRAVLEGDVITLVCGNSANGNPTPTISWTDNNGATVSDGPEVSGSNTLMLTITNTTRNLAGNWTCTVENSVSSIENQIMLLVAGTPMLNALTFRVNDTHVVIMWTFDDLGAPVSSFNVTIDCGGQPIMEHVPAPVTGNEVTSTQTLTSYPADTRCTVTVGTSNLLGSSNSLTNTFMTTAVATTVTPTSGGAAFSATIFCILLLMIASLGF